MRKLEIKYQQTQHIFLAINKQIIIRILRLNISRIRNSSYKNKCYQNKFSKKKKKKDKKNNGKLMKRNKCK